MGGGFSKIRLEMRGLGILLVPHTGEIRYDVANNSDSSAIFNSNASSFADIVLYGTHT